MRIPRVAGAFAVLAAALACVGVGESGASSSGPLSGPVVVSDSHVEHGPIEAPADMLILPRPSAARTDVGAVATGSGITTRFAWPVRKTAWTEPGFEAITNFIDHNPTSALRDFRDGTRTYNGHNGTDIVLWPAPWNLMDTGKIKVVAAAPGTIVAKQDGQFDRNCVTGSQPANYVIIQHADGSQAWYWHLRNGSVTKKAVGSTVTLGEVLGTIGSSGSSTTPHLHFEVRNAAGEPVDPWVGPGNAHISTSLWKTQRAYRSPAINATYVMSAAPTAPNCSSESMPILSRVSRNSTFVTSVWLADVTTADTIQVAILRPNGTVHASTQVTPNQHFAVAYYYWTWGLANAPTGTWTLRVTMGSQVRKKTFTVY